MAISQKLQDVQTFIIQTHREIFVESPTPMKLQKLCYYAQGLALGESNTELFEDNFQAWQHGPVNPDLYDMYKNYQWRPIIQDVTLSSENALSELEQTHIRRVVNAFGKFDGAALSTMTHRETPWIDAREGLPETEGSTNEISKQSIQRYFSEKLSSIRE